MRLEPASLDIESSTLPQNCIGPDPDIAPLGDGVTRQSPSGRFGGGGGGGGAKPSEAKRFSVFYMVLERSRAPAYFFIFRVMRNASGSLL